jgi:hypothetical protein
MGMSWAEYSYWYPCGKVRRAVVGDGRKARREREAPESMGGSTRAFGGTVLHSPQGRMIA